MRSLRSKEPMNKLTASDRKSLIRLASSLPKGSEERRAILAGLGKRRDIVAAGRPNPKGTFTIAYSNDGSYDVKAGKKKGLSLREVARIFEKADAIRRPVEDGGLEYADEGFAATRQTSRILGFPDSFETGWSVVDETTGDVFSWFGELEYEGKVDLGDFLSRGKAQPRG